MAAIVQFPAIVEELLKTFVSVFPDKRTREHFGEYLTGLMVAKRKNVSAINLEFAQTTDQSCLKCSNQLKLGCGGTQQASAGVVAAGSLDSLFQAWGYSHRQRVDRPQRQAHRGCRLLLVPRRKPAQNRSRLSHHQLRLYIGQTLFVGIQTVCQEGSMPGRRQKSESHYQSPFQQQRGQVSDFPTSLPTFFLFCRMSFALRPMQK